MKPIHPRLLVLLCALFLGAVRSSAIQVVFSEVMYQPIANKPEFIEVWNITNTPLDTARWTFTDGITFTFPDFNTASPQAHFLRANERIIISSASDATTRAAYPGIPAGVRIFTWTAGALSNSGEKITLVDKNGVVVASLTYGDGGKWPIAPDGTGHSLVLTDENQDMDNWRLWRSSTNNGGSPGVADPAPPAVGLALNEVHFNTLGRVDWIELRNNSPTTTQVGSGLFLASTLDFSDKVALSGNVTPNAIVSFAVNFPADASGDIRLFLVDTNNQVRDAVAITRRPGRDSWQVFPAGSREWYNDVNDTKDAENNPARNVDIVINELMPDPPSGERDGEFVELYNKGTASVDVSGWSLDDDVNFTIPPGTIIPAGGYLVIAANATWLNSQYAGLTAIGNWSGTLNNNGDRLRLEDANGNLADVVDFRIGGEWPSMAGGEGSSLELVNPNADNSLGSAWRDSDESNKSTFQSFTINGGTYGDQTVGGVNDDEIRVWTTGDSHIIFKNLVLRPTTGSGNIFVNGEVTTLTNENVTGWQSRGTHGQTFHDAQGVHMVADGSGDNKCNHMEKSATGMTLGQQYTMTFDARWVSGSPRVVAQSWDLTWGGTALLPIPNNLGTPGAQNSRFVPNPPPQLTALNHSPVSPTTTQVVTITAKVSSAAPLASVQLFHRLDNITATGVWNSLAMVDNGTGGDARAGDGIYTAQVTPSAFSGYSTPGAIIQYYVHATTDVGQAVDLPRGGASVPGMWIADNTSSPTDLRRVRVIISAYWGNAFNQDSATGGQTATYNYKHPRLSNHYFPCVVIVNENTIYYDCLVHKTGSPFTRETNNALTRGRITFPGDKKFRGKSRFYWDNDGAGGSMLHNRIHRYWMYLFGVPSNESEVCRVTKNTASGFTARETNEVFDADFLNRLYPNGNDGTFYEMDDRFWIGDDGTTLLSNNDGSWDYKTADSQGQDNPTAYHNQFTPQSRQVEYDYSAFLGWCLQLEQNPTAEMLERIADTKAMTAYAAIRGYSADWDNITMSRGKNGFFYNRSTDKKWMMLHWDSDLSFQSGHIGDAVIGGLTNVGTYYGKPVVRRYLNFYLNEMLTTYAANGTRIGAWLTAEENASSSYSVPNTYVTWPTTSNGSATRPDIIRSFIGASSFNATFATTVPTNGSTVSVNTISVSGTAPPNAFSIICVNHPEGVQTWTATSNVNTSPWMISGIQLRSGTNLLTFRRLDFNGFPIGSDITLTLEKTGNAPPVAVMDIDPNSQNVELGQPTTLSALNSYDPEATGPLTYAWTITPNTGFNVLAPSSGQRILTFTIPGSYNVNLQVTDFDGNITSIDRVLSVYGGSGFDAFNTNFLTGYALENVKLRDNSPGAAWYSLNETSNNLVLSLTGTTSLPVRTGAPVFPLVVRPLPASVDCSLQTNLSLETRKIGLPGTFFTGLYIETMEGGVLTRYVFGLDAGTSFKLYRSSGGGAYSQVGITASYSGGDVIIRMLRTGTTLDFQRRVNGVWLSAATQAIQAGSTLVRGGLFASTGLVNTNVVTPGIGMRVAFDYLLLSDPGSTTDLVGNLRITEIMYNPAGVGGVEFLELRNFGANPINLNGAYFEDGTPFSTQFTFGNLSLQPGQYCVVTNDTAAFTALYGAGVTIAGQYTGSLSNDGERIVLRDANGNLIHDFSYGDTAPWPLTPDGKGPSLEVSVSDPALYGLGTSWRASYEIGGTPGYQGLAVDSDQDGYSDGVELAYGSNPNNAGSSPLLPATTRNASNGNVTLTWQSQNGRTYSIQYRDDLTTGTWQVLDTVTATGTSATFTDTTAGATPQRFYRLGTQFP